MKKYKACLDCKFSYYDHSLVYNTLLCKRTGERNLKLDADTGEMRPTTLGIMSCNVKRSTSIWKGGCGKRAWLFKPKEDCYEDVQACECK